MEITRHLPTESTSFPLSPNRYDVLRHLPEGTPSSFPETPNNDQFIRDFHIPEGKRVQELYLAYLSLYDEEGVIQLPAQAQTFDHFQLSEDVNELSRSSSLEVHVWFSR